MRAKGGDGRPSIDYSKHRFWDEWDELKRPFPPGSDTQQCIQLHFRVDHPRANSWDWYFDDGDGIMSARACGLLWPWLKNCCVRFETSINGAPYYFIRGNRRYSDCFDADNSVFGYLSPDLPYIDNVQRLSFISAEIRDPSIFRILPYVWMLATDLVRRAVVEAKLEGFEFVDCQNLGRDS
jgi:hypothetical protein